MDSYARNRSGLRATAREGDFAPAGTAVATPRRIQPTPCPLSEKLIMYHAIEFRVEFTVDVEVSPKDPLERMTIRRGTRIRTQIKPYVAETLDGPNEVADLFFENGTATRRVPFAYFSFVES